MKKFLLIILLFPFLIWGNEKATHYYIGEMKCCLPEDQEPQHYGLFFLKRTLLPQENRFVDTCFLSGMNDEIFNLEQISDLQGDLNETVISSPSGLITGSGELIGFPWEWTSLHQHMELISDSSVHIDVQNTWEEESILSIASVYTIEDDGKKEFFATFSAKLYEVNKVVMENFFEEE